MTRRERVIALLRRWNATHDAITNLSNKERSILAGWLAGENESARAKRANVTRARGIQILDKVFETLADYLFDQPEEPIR